METNKELKIKTRTNVKIKMIINHDQPILDLKRKLFLATVILRD